MTYPYQGAGGGVACTEIVETLYPSGDSVDGSWLDDLGGTNLSGHLDSTSDSEFIEWASTTPDDCPTEDSSGAGVVLMTDPTGVPDLSSCQGLRVNFRCRFTDTDVGCYTILFRLLQGASTERWTSGNLTTGISESGFANETFTLTGGELDAITDHDDLRLEFTCAYGFDDIFTSTIAVFQISYSRLEYF